MTTTQVAAAVRTRVDRMAGLPYVMLPVAWVEQLLGAIGGPPLEGFTWPSIDTAPRDGQSLVLFGPGGVTVGSFDARYGQWVDDETGDALSPRVWFFLPTTKDGQ